jgi:RNA polymerase sigma-70 factor (ECF subfamily)
MLEDKRLIWKLKRGSPEALERVYEKYQHFLITVAMALSNNVEVSEDVVHDVFVSCLAAPDRLRATGNLKAYLAICVANLTRDRLRRQQRAPMALDDSLQIESAGMDPEQRALEQEKALKLNRALAQLPFEQREVITLHLHGSMRFTQIATLRAASVNTVRSQYRYGLNKLRALLNGEVTK